MTDTAEELRIIAKDGNRLPPLDREAIARAADEYEAIHRELLATQQALTESQGHRIALHERIATRGVSYTLPPTYQAHWNYPK